MCIGTITSGMARFRIEGNELVAMPRLVAPQIASNNVLFVRSDSRGWVWIGTDRGINVLTGHSNIHTDSSDGPLSNDLDQASILEGHDGSMWFGTSSGLSHLLDPVHLASGSELHPRVTAITYGDHSATLDHRFDTPWTSAPLVIRVDDFDFMTGPLLFRYKLDGVDTRWTETSAREIRYANVPAGQLAFEMYAVDASHNRVSRPVIRAIRIHPPWWRRWWFYLTMWLVGIGLVAGAWWARMSYLIGQRAQLEELVRCRTAEIASANDRLAKQSALEQRRLEEMVQARTTEIEIAQQELHRLAWSDALTGLPNRRSILAKLDDWLASPCAEGRTVAALLLDVDHFKLVNDRFGHLAGDDVLAQYGLRLAAAVQSDEIAGRYGGEEFLIILRGHGEALARRAEAIWHSVSRSDYVFAGRARSVTASAGLAILRTGEQNVSLIERADAALYKAKENGRARLEVAEDEPPPVGASSWSMNTDTTDLRSQLHGALAANEFTLVFQPIVDVRKQIVISCEALLRWNSPVHGPVSPAVFIPLAQEIGVMSEIGVWVLREACREAASWSTGSGVSVNLSPCQLGDPGLVQQVANALRDSNLGAEKLELEVTESAMISDIAGAQRVLHDLRDLGLSIALDDFGTGFSSLSFLQTLPFDRIKIDKSFVTELGVSSRSLAIVRSLVALCRGLGAKITAEGVEADVQAELLMAAGCSELQGYLLGRPTPATQIREWLRAYDAREGAPPASDVEAPWDRSFAIELAEHQL